VYTYAKNFHTANLLYPFNDPIGQSLSGIVTISNYQISASERREFPISTNFIDKLFDLDRCFSLNYLPIEGSDNYLVLLNLHMSAYDEGGKIRAKQLELLNSVLKSERDKGNYVVAGGDFNHCLIADQFASDEEALNHFESEQYVPDWVKGSILHGSDLTEGFEIVARIDDVDVATCRGADIPYTKGVNYSTVIDGFIVSDNVKVVYEGTVDTQYAYSDHNPVNIRFVLE
jgi:exonuclease III